jgi:hypothetical protein
MSDRSKLAAATKNIVLVPLDKLKKSPKNVRQVPHTKADIQAFAASIAAIGMLQYPVVEPEVGPKGKPTGFYLVNAGEGRRLAQLLRVKRKQIKADEPIRCILDVEHSATEIRTPSVRTCIPPTSTRLSPSCTARKACVPRTSRRASVSPPRWSGREAGGSIVRDLFDSEGGGFFADTELLSRLAREKLQARLNALYDRYSDGDGPRQRCRPVVPHPDGHRCPAPRGIQAPRHCSGRNLGQARR